jgi:carbonic anhydrase/acetyltransferase-like protein (isoleucine patch superfamily)
MNNKIDFSKPLILMGSNTAIFLYADLYEELGGVSAAIMDSDYYGNTDAISGIPVKYSEKTFDFEKEKDNYNWFVGSNWVYGMDRDADKRKNFIALAEQYSLNVINLIHPSANLSNRATTIGKGNFFGINSILSAYTKIGNYCAFQAGTILGHHSNYGNNIVLQRGVIVASFITLEDDVYVGIGSRVLKPSNSKNDLILKQGCLIHPGLTVMRTVDTMEIISAVTPTKKVYRSEVIKE